MLIFLAFSITFLQFFIHICFMKNLLEDGVPKSVKTTTGRWVHVYLKPKELVIDSMSRWPKASWAES
jgi:hypothetical protein